ncbi:MAG: M16 family metallopeptidase [Pseudomonadota bacterium]
MNRVLFVLALAVAAAATVAAPVRAAPKVERVLSPGGIEAWLVEDRMIPVLALEFSFRGGAALDPAGKEGLAQLATDLMTEAAGDHDSQAFQAMLEDRSIGLSLGAGLDTLTGSLKTLNEHREVAVDLLRLMLTRPRFDTADLERLRARTLAALARASEEPNTIAGRTFMATAFPGHPYGRPVRGTPDSVAKLGPEDLKAFLAARLARDNLVIAAVGDITPFELGALLDLAFGELPAASAPGAVAEAAPHGRGRTIVVKRAIPQSVVSFGEAGVKRDDPDFYTATVMNYILGGGGFTSRLTAELREKRGLAYSVSSYLSPFDHAALVMGGTASANARVKQSIELIRAEWRRMRDEGPSAEELAEAKTYLTGSFALRLDSTARIARTLASMQYDRLGIDYLDRRNGLIEAVTLEDVRRLARRLLDPDRLLVVVVGEPEGLDGASAPGGGG